MTLLVILSALVALLAAIGYAELRLARCRDVTRLEEESIKGANALRGLEAELSGRIGAILSALALLEKIVKADTMQQAETSAALRLLPPVLEALKNRFDERLNEVEERKLPDAVAGNSQGFLSRIQSQRKLLIEREEESLKTFREIAKLAGKDPDKVPIRVEGGR